ncbi:hypothetical protein PMO31116_00515 [Pandoraea morbifera]|uniref:Uncharacterized protein n=1 Tax=Pandoraea morbifera TaxID=2508300 RepID=A0A5E4S299_9BURK|nr:hypothetical protein [Pandoraea morbifera]VVD69281.1 hypothetical protein PMO31116_00515 [Pandoraea morbifera]
MTTTDESFIEQQPESSPPKRKGLPKIPKIMLRIFAVLLLIWCVAFGLWSAYKYATTQEIENHGAALAAKYAKMSDAELWAKRAEFEKSECISKMWCTPNEFGRQTADLYFYILRVDPAHFKANPQAKK